ncbi:MAG TPA: DUF2219 family protein [Paracoccaceae bacterium]|nr:DUF2219 family protein [Paracoccaceae bacterium]HMO71791.1 DUF2219 family protein [Paracoccaceae bacterium]
MLRLLPAFLALLVTIAPPAAAQERQTLGYGRLFVNDGVGDARDRWRTGAYTVSVLRGPDWNGTLPGRPGTILEYRARAEIVAPANLSSPAPGDRRYAGILSGGVHTHFALAGAEARIGLDLVVTGKATGLGSFQKFIHRVVNLPQPDLSQQIPNGIHPMLSAEIGRDIALGPSARLRPFAEAQLGFESLARVGADLTFGRFGSGALMLRDTTTGQRYRGIRGEGAPGVSFVLGGDVARVGDSALLPTPGPAPRDMRSRLRAGLHWQGAKGEAFWGVAWLSPEFEGQQRGQAVGTLRLRLRF